MSYCVNCGVHLKDTARECPLCRTSVVNPTVPVDASVKNIEKLKEEQYENSFDRSLWIKLTSITLVTPAVISLLINWIFQKELSWSLFVSISLTLVWVWSISPFFFNNNRLLKWIPIGAGSMLGFLYVIELLSTPTGWFIPIATPITLSFFIIFAIFVILVQKKKIKELQIPAAIFISFGLFCICINCAINLYLNDTLQPDWSLIIFTTCLAFASVVLVLQQRPWIVEELKYWFRI